MLTDHELGRGKNSTITTTYLERLTKEKERSIAFLTDQHIKPGFVRNDVVEWFACEFKKIYYTAIENSSVKDAGYCLLLNKLMHYLISFYGGLKEMAITILEEDYYRESGFLLRLNSLAVQQNNWLGNVRKK